MDSLKFNLMKRQLGENQSLAFQFGSQTVTLDGSETERDNGLSYRSNLYPFNEISHLQIVDKPHQTSDSTSKTDQSIDPNTIISSGVEKALKQSGTVKDEASPRERLTTWLETSK